MAAPELDVLSDDIFLPNPYAGEGDTSQEPSYELPPHIDEVALTRQLAQYLLTQDLETTEGKREYIRHAARLKEIVTHNFTSRGTTQELSQEHRWRDLFWHEAKKPISRIVTDLYLATKIPEQATVRLEKTRQQLGQFIETLDSRDMFEQLESLFRISTEPSDIAELILASRIGFFAQTEETASRHMRIELITDTGLYAEVNRGAFVYIIRELIHNTYKYANQQRGGIRIRAFNCMVTDPSASSPTQVPMVCIQVRDFGMGVPNVDDLWAFRKRQTTEAEGTGVGLYFVKRAIEGNRGKIYARNGTLEEGGGLHFEIFVPATTEAAYRTRQSEIAKEKVEAALREMRE